MSIIDVSIGSILLHVTSGLTLKITSVGTGIVYGRELYGPHEDAPKAILLPQLREYRVIGLVG